MRMGSLKSALGCCLRVPAATGVLTLALLCCAPAVASGPASQQALATLEQCVTSVVQAERAATFAGEMTAVPGTAHMAMRIEVLEQLPAEERFHAVRAPGLGVWRGSDLKVKIYKYVKQVTDLSSPATYRGLVRFRWIGANGRVIKRAERITPRCVQPAAPPPVAPAAS
jgi:hypothetical protein